MNEQWLLSDECVERFVAPLPGVELHLAGRAEVAPAPWRALPLPFDPGHMELVTDERSRPIWRLAAAFITRHAERIAARRTKV